jgi:hypothetical protein
VDEVATGRTHDAPMNQNLGRRLSLIFDRSADAPAGAEGAHPGAAVLYPLVDFVAYASDCTLSGRIRLRSDRLTDMLNDHEELHLVDVMVQSLVEPEAVEVREVVVPRDELLLVHATGPRGDQARRTRTRQTSVAVVSGPYAVRGYLHSVPFLDAMAGLNRRSPMIPLTDAVVDYPLGGELYRQRVGTVIVNRSRIDHIIESVEHDGALGIAPTIDDGRAAPDFGARILAGSNGPAS